MIRKIQVLWYLNKEDFENYCIDFKKYESHKLEGYEICDVDEDLIYDLCDINPNQLEPIGYFKNKKEIENYISDYITNSEFELELNSPELKNKIKKSIEKINFTNEDYYICIGPGIGCNDSIITNWYDSLKKEYSKALKEDLWVLKVCNYDPYNLALTGKTLTYVLSDILNLKESYFDKLIPNKGSISVDEWNNILDKVYKKNKIYLGLNRVV